MVIGDRAFGERMRVGTVPHPGIWYRCRRVRLSDRRRSSECGVWNGVESR